ncbi:ribbon-helix-helix protein, CopG family [Rhizobium ruizarguesonis]|uniref:ribbon-helix-helix protein, CopG family n=1 Tax=Rhizobium ruizarguesonis TaxID=2081791 RepID=UPI0018E0B363|nr:ribbon-helix-helix protein, CopG family [Rhizobium ruizarguesonis]
MKAKDSVLTIKLEQELRDAFSAEAAAQDRPVSSVLRELMRDYLQRRRQDQFRQMKSDMNFEQHGA